MTKAFNDIGSQAQGAKDGLIKLKNSWENADRATYVAVMQSAASNIHRFANIGDDPGEGLLAAIDMVAQFASLAGPMVELASIGRI